MGVKLDKNVFSVYVCRFVGYPTNYGTLFGMRNEDVSCVYYFEYFMTIQPSLQGKQINNLCLCFVHSVVLVVVLLNWLSNSSSLWWESNLSTTVRSSLSRMLQLDWFLEQFIWQLKLILNILQNWRVLKNVQQS